MLHVCKRSILKMMATLAAAIAKLSMEEIARFPYSSPDRYTKRYGTLTSLKSYQKRKAKALQSFLYCLTWKGVAAKYYLLKAIPRFKLTAIDGSIAI